MNASILVKFIHVLLAIIAVGFSASYMLWMWKSADDCGRLAHTLRTIRFIDSRFTNPAFLGLLVTGVGMVLIIPVRLTTFWIDVAVVLFLLVAILGGAFYAPTFRRLRLAAENPGADVAALRPLIRRALGMNVVVGAIVLIIIALMVFKPSSPF